MSESALDVLRASGWAAALLLAGALTCTPTARVLGAWSRPAASAAVTRARRRLGIAAASLALVHAVTVLLVYLPHDVREIAADVAAVTWLRSGALALALLVPLLVTSFPPLVRRLRVAAWKPLHRLAYLAAALVVHHLSLAPFAPRAWVLGLALWLIATALLRLAARPKAGQGEARL